MSIPQLLISFTVLLTVAIATEQLAKIIRLPVGGLLVLVGFVVSESIVALGYDTGLRWHSFRDLIIYVFLPVLVFSSALQTDVTSLKRYWAPTLALAVPLLVVSTLFCGAIIYFFVGHPVGFPWVAAMIAAALFVATDPLAVTEVLERHRINPPVTTLIEGEGMFGDATAIALFSSLIALALTMGDVNGALVGKVALTFLWAVVSGVLVGGAGAWMLRATLWEKLPDVERGIISLVFVYAIYLVTELVFKSSGVVALTVSGLILGADYRRRQLDQESEFTSLLWRFLGRISYLSLFLLVGATITLAMFEQRWLAMIIAIGAVLLARLPAIFISLPLQNYLLKEKRLNLPQLSIVYLGGVRGAVTLALAISLPTELEYWWTIQSMAYGVVLFSLFVQAPLVELIIYLQRKKT